MCRFARTTPEREPAPAGSTQRILSRCHEEFIILPIILRRPAGTGLQPDRRTRVAPAAHVAADGSFQPSPMV